MQLTNHKRRYNILDEVHLHEAEAHFIATAHGRHGEA